MPIKWDRTIEEAVEAVAVLQEVAHGESRAFRVLDVGAAIKPLVYATHCIDILPYDNRAWFGHIAHTAVTRDDEKFSEETWTQQDICELPWPYEDNFFDFVWCTQTVEDVRDPIAVIKEMSRVGHMGFIQTIHRDFESLKNVERENMAGYMHHRWLIEPDNQRIKFTQKFPQLQVDPQYNPAMTGNRFLSIWWAESAEAWEYIPMSPEEIHDWLFNYAEETRRKAAAGESM